MMYLVKATLAFLWALLDNAHAKYGYPCTSTSDCNEYIGRETCQDGRCLCRDDIYFQYLKDGSVSCYGYKAYCSKWFKCPGEQVCKKEGCSCKTGEVLVKSESCLKLHFVTPLEKCNVSDGVVYACNDPQTNSYCHKGKCQCFSTHYFDFNNSTICKSKKTYNRFHHLSEYKAQPSGYCVFKHDCIEGLTCADNNTCVCPNICSYKQKEKYCECGEVELETPTGVFVVGVALGLFFSICWCRIFKKTIRKHRQNHGQMPSKQAPSDDDSPPPYSEVVSPSYPPTLYTPPPSP